MRTRLLVGCVVAGWATGLSAVTTETSSYALQLAPGYNAVANPLDVGGNTLDELFPDMPDGALCAKFDWATQAFLAPAQYQRGWGWMFETFEAAVLRPGEGAFLFVPVPWQVAVTGQVHAFEQRPGLGRGFNLVGCQRLGDCGFAEVFGFGPQVGDEVFLFEQPVSFLGSNVVQAASSYHRYWATGWDQAPVFRQGRAAFVFLSDAPHLTRQPVGRSVPLGSNVSFDVQVAGAAPFFYQWRVGSLLLPGQTNRTLSLVNVQATNAGAYSVVVTNGFGAATSAPALLRVLTAPAIVAQPTNVTVLEGATAELTVEAIGSPPLSYFWYHNGQWVSNASPSRPVLTLSNVQPAQAGLYAVVVSNALGTVTSEAALLTVIERPRIVQPLEPIVAAPGQEAIFHVVASGTPPLFYYWRRNGVVIREATNATLLLPRVQPQDSGNYSVTVVNTAGAASSEPVPLRVQAPTLPLADKFGERLVLQDPTGVGRGQNRGATLEPAEPLHHGKAGGRSVWLGWVAPVSGVATFRATGSTFDTLLAVYTGMALEQLVPVAGDDDRGGFLTSEVRFNADAGVMYQIAVDGFNGQEGDIVLSWVVDPVQDRLPVILIQPKDVLASPSDTVLFEVVTLDTVTQFLWFVDDQPLPGQTEPVLRLFDVPLTAAGTYFARVFRGNSFVDSQPARLQFSLAEPGAAGPTNFAADKLADALEAVSLPALPAPRGAGGKPAPLQGSPPGESLASLTDPEAALLRPASVIVGYAGTQVFSTYGAVSEPGEPVHCGVVGGASMWYSYTAPADGTVYMNTEGSSFDTILAVYTGPGTSYATLVPVACDNNSGQDGQTSKLSFPATAGTTYAIAVDGVNGATGLVNLNYRLLVPLVLSRVAGTNETFRFRVTATPNFPFTLQRSPNLSNWVNVLTTNTATGNFTFFESNITARAQRFYRAVQTP